MDYYISSEQLLELAETTKEIVANWKQRDKIVAILGKVFYQKVPSNDSKRHLLGRWG
jgi:hypothetical protein